MNAPSRPWRMIPLDWEPLYALPPLQARVALELALKTEHEARRLRIGNRFYVVPRGAVLFDTCTLALRSRVSRGSVLKALRKLEDWGFAQVIVGAHGWPEPGEEPKEEDHRKDQRRDRLHSLSPRQAPSLLLWRDQGEALGIRPVPNLGGKVLSMA